MASGVSEGGIANSNQVRSRKKLYEIVHTDTSHDKSESRIQILSKKVLGGAKGLVILICPKGLVSKIFNFLESDVGQTLVMYTRKKTHRVTLRVVFISRYFLVVRIWGGGGRRGAEGGVFVVLSLRLLFGNKASRNGCQGKFLYSV